MGSFRSRASGFHEDLSREEAVEGGGDRAFGLVFAAVFTGLGVYALWSGSSVSPLLWLGGAAVFAVAAVFAPGLLGPLNRLWTAFGLLLHRIVSPLLMGIIFFLVVTPIAWMMRWKGKDPLRLARDPAAETYWIVRQPPGPEPERIRRQF